MLLSEAFRTAPVIHLVVSGAQGAQGIVTPELTALVTAAAASASTASSSASTANSASTAAQTARNATLAALAATSLSGAGRYGTRALATADLANIAADGYVVVLADETQAGQTSIYRKVGASLTLIGPAIGNTKTVPIALDELAESFYSIGQYIFNAPMTPGVRANTQGTEDAVDVSLAVSGGRLTQGPTGGTNYWNYGVSLGFNQTASFGRQNLDMPLARLALETKFAQGQATSIFGIEAHLPEVQPIMDGGGAQATLRPISIFTPHKHSERFSRQNGISFQMVTINELDPDQRARRQTFYDQNGVSTVEHGVVNGQPFQYHFNKNNAPFLYQKNAAENALVPGEYLDDQNRWRKNGSSFQIGSTPAVSVYSVDFGHGRYFRESLDLAPVAGGGWQYHICNASITGDYNGINLNGVNISGTLYPSRTYNSHATGGIVTRQETSGGKNGFAFVDQSVGNTHYFVGRNAAGQFVIANDPGNLEGTNNPIMLIKPFDGNIGRSEVSMPNVPNFADDAAAATGGLSVGALYFNAATGALTKRLA